MLLDAIRNRVGRRIRAMPWRIAHRLSASRPIKALRIGRYRRAITAHQSKLPTMSGYWREIVASLGHSGITQKDVMALDLPGHQAVIDAGKALTDEWQEQLIANARTGVRFLQVPAAAMARYPAIYRFGLSTPLLAAVEAYLGMPVAYDGVTLQFTVADGRAVSTREWHRDREDRRMVKLAIYLNDVDAQGGPFQLLSGSNDILKAVGGRDQFHLDTEKVASAIAVGTIPPPLTCEGMTGTAVFADTARFFHRGKPATGRHRAALFFSYFTRNPERPYFCNRSSFSRTELDGLTAGLSPAQRQAALWHSELPFYWRVIPSASV